MFEVVSVLRDGKREPYHTNETDDGVRVYFGRSDYDLPPGMHTYELTYRTNRQLGFFKDHDELYWNVTGNRWKFPIDVVTATVQLPANVRNVVTDLDGYTGYAAEKGKAFTAKRDEESNPVFRAEGLTPEQGLTIVVSWPKGLIAAPSAEQKRAWFIADNKQAVFGLGWLILTLLYRCVVSRTPRLRLCHFWRSTESRADVARTRRDGKTAIRQFDSVRYDLSGARRKGESVGLAGQILSGSRERLLVSNG